MNQITILFFATIKEKIGQKVLNLEIPDDYCVAALKDNLVGKYPLLLEVINRSLVAVNQNFAQDDEKIPPHAEVAFFPPVSGGSEAPTLVDITDQVLDLAAILAQITSEQTGAACFFTGLVRGQTRVDHDPESGHPIHPGLNVEAGPDGPIVETVSLEYEAYLPMARLKMFQIANEIRSRWPSVYGIALIQRIGLLVPTQPSVCVACSAPHRDTGVFEAARYGIDRLKEIVPIWKKEIGRDGEAWIEGDYLPSHGD